MEKMLLIFHIVVCVLLILLVLLQSGREGMGVIFGGGTSSVFGSSGAGGILVKLTAFVAVLFLLTSLGYNLLTSVNFETESAIIDLAKQNPFSGNSSDANVVNTAISNEASEQSTSQLKTNEEAAAESQNGTRSE